MKENDFRADVDFSDINMRDKIKKFQLEKFPYILVIGDKEIEQEVFSVRSRKEGDLGAMNMAALMDYLKEEIKMGKPKCIIE